MVEIDNDQAINPAGTVILRKFVIGIILGVIFSLFVFLAFIGLGSSINEVLKNSGSNIPFTPLVWLSFMGIALITSMIGSFVTAVIYNVLWQDDYYDVKLMISGIITSNLLLLIIFLLFYVYTGTVLVDLDKVFIVYGFHLFFSIFISFTIMDVTKNANLSPVYIIGNSFGFIIALLIFFIIFSMYSGKGSETKNILFYPPILAFAIIPTIATIWEKVYYKFYEMGNNFLYIPPLTEIIVDEEEEDEINVKLD